MNLREMESLDQFQAYYAEKGLTTDEAKIEHLREEMDIAAVRCGSGSTPRNVLNVLEDCALVGSWRGH